MEIFRNRWIGGLAGILLANSVVSIFNTIQSIILNSSSGVPPIHRIFEFPIFVVVSFIWGVFLAAVCSIVKLRLVKGDAYFRIGLILGSAGIGGIVHPWLPPNVYTDWIVVILVFVGGVIAAFRLAQPDGSR
jgi:hypothetical protein